MRSGPGRAGPGEIVVRDGVLEAVTWLDGAEADGIDATGVVVAPGFIDLHAHLREPGNEDAETIASGLAAAAHGGFTTVCAMPNTTPTLDEPGVLARIRAAGAASGSPVELLAHGAVTVGPRRRDARRARRAGGCGRRRVPRRRRAGPVGLDPARRAGLCGRARAADRRSPRGPDPDRRRRGQRRLRGDRARAARLAGRGRGGGRRPRPGDPRRRRRGRAGRPAAPDPRLDGGALELVRRAKAAGLPVTCDVTPHHLALTDEWVAGARRWAWEASGDPWARRARRRRAVRLVAARQPAAPCAGRRGRVLAALVDGTADAVATDHAPHAEVDKAVEFGLAANGISGIETALGSSSRPWTRAG